MRQLTRWLSIVVVATAWGCSGDNLPSFPSMQSHLSAPVHAASVDAGNWTPWFFGGWQPGLGDVLTSGAAVDAVVEANDICVPTLRQVWDARSSCKRFLVTTTADGWLEASIRWDASAPGFDTSLAGEVVLVAPDGRFASSGWQHIEEQVFGRVQPGNYGLLVMSYVPDSLPFQIRAEFRPD